MLIRCGLAESTGCELVEVQLGEKQCQSRLRLTGAFGPLAVIGSSDLEDESAMVGNLRFCHDFELFHRTHVGDQEVAGMRTRSGISRSPGIGGANQVNQGEVAENRERLTRGEQIQVAAQDHEIIPPLSPFHEANEPVRLCATSRRVSFATRVAETMDVDDRHSPCRGMVVQADSLRISGTIGWPHRVGCESPMDKLRVVSDNGDPVVDEQGDAEVLVVDSTRSFNRPRIASNKQAPVIWHGPLNIAEQVSPLGQSSLAVVKGRPAFKSRCSCHLLEAQDISIALRQPFDQGFAKDATPSVEHDDSHDIILVDEC